MLNLGVVRPAHPGQEPTIDHPAIREWMYAREMFRRLGFRPEDLYFAVNPINGHPGTAISLVLRAQDKEFAWVIGLVDHQIEGLDERYEQWTEIWNSGAKWNIDDFHASWAFDKRWEVLHELVAMGFHIPKNVN